MTITMPEVADTRARMLQAYRDGLLALIEDATQRPGDADLLDEEGVTAMSLGDWDGVPVVTRKRLDEAIRAIFGQPIPAPSATTVEVSTPATILVSAVCPRCDIAQLISMSVHPELLIDDEGSELRVKAKAKGRSHICGQLPLEASEAVDETEQIGLLMEIESFAERVHGMLVEIAKLPAEDDAEEMPSFETVASWDRATIDQVDAWATACLARGPDPYAAVPPLPRVLGGDADPEPAAEDAGEPEDDEDLGEEDLGDEDALPRSVADDGLDQITDVPPEPCPYPGCIREADHRGRHKVPPTDATTGDDEGDDALLPF